MYTYLKVQYNGQLSQSSNDMCSSTKFRQQCGSIVQRQSAESKFVIYKSCNWKGVGEGSESIEIAWQVGRIGEYSMLEGCWSTS